MAAKQDLVYCDLEKYATATGKSYGVTRVSVSIGHQPRTMVHIREWIRTRADATVLLPQRGTSFPVADLEAIIYALSRVLYDVQQGRIPELTSDPLAKQKLQVKVA